jgi:hypothetical protein
MPTFLLVIGIRESHKLAFYLYEMATENKSGSFVVKSAMEFNQG